MSDTPVYMIANLKISDPVEYKIYEKGFFNILKKHGGQFITFDDNAITFEGNTPREGRMIIFSFPSEQAAKNWYADNDYQKLSDHRRAGTQTDFITLVHGMPQRA
jgi:uncharacterized protein (DUF1330 family)